MEIDNTQDIIDVRDIIERYEEARDDERAEAGELLELLDALRGNGGDVQWHGAWYPLTLIRDDYFEQYARDYAEEIGAIGGNWPNNCVDWERAADELQIDYTSVEYDGTTYWYR